MSIVDGKLEKADLQYLGKANRARAFADSYSKVCFVQWVGYLQILLVMITLSEYILVPPQGVSKAIIGQILCSIPIVLWFVSFPCDIVIPHYK